MGPAPRRSTALFRPVKDTFGTMLTNGRTIGEEVSSS
jgi:hypothetical protein